MFSSPMIAPGWPTPCGPNEQAQRQQWNAVLPIISFFAGFNKPLFHQLRNNGTLCSSKML